MGRRRGERPPGYWPSKVNRGWGGAGRRRGGSQEGAESAPQAAAAGEAREAAVRSLRAERSRADRHPAPAPARDPGWWRGPAAPQPMELENIVANTVLLKAREGEAAGWAAGCEESGHAASELGGATPPPRLFGQRTSLPTPGAGRSPTGLVSSSSATARGSPGPGRGGGQATALAARGE